MSAYASIEEARGFEMLKGNAGKASLTAATNWIATNEKTFKAHGILIS